MNIAEKSYKGKTVKVFIESKLVKKKLQNKFFIKITKKDNRSETFESLDVDGALRLASKILGIEVKKEP